MFPPTMILGAPTASAFILLAAAPFFTEQEETLMLGETRQKCDPEQEEALTRSWGGPRAPNSQGKAKPHVQVSTL